MLFLKNNLGRNSSELFPKKTQLIELINSMKELGFNSVCQYMAVSDLPKEVEIISFQSQLENVIKRHGNILKLDSENEFDLSECFGNSEQYKNHVPITGNHRSFIAQCLGIAPIIQGYVTEYSDAIKLAISDNLSSNIQINLSKQDKVICAYNLLDNSSIKDTGMLKKAGFTTGGLAYTMLISWKLHHRILNSDLSESKKKELSELLLNSLTYNKACTLNTSKNMSEIEKILKGSGSKKVSSLSSKKIKELNEYACNSDVQKLLEQVANGKSFNIVKAETAIDNLEKQSSLVNELKAEIETLKAEIKTLKLELSKLE